MGTTGIVTLLLLHEEQHGSTRACLCLQAFPTPSSLPALLSVGRFVSHGTCSTQIHACLEPCMTQFYALTLVSSPLASLPVTSPHAPRRPQDKHAPILAIAGPQNAKILTICHYQHAHTHKACTHRAALLVSVFAGWAWWEALRIRGALQYRWDICRHDSGMAARI